MGYEPGDCDEDGFPIWTWGDSDAPESVRHAMSEPDGLLPCCGRTTNQIGKDWTTSDPDRVNCPGPAKP